tara:strand:+ start:398 stop:766 length:369 start_codon:yes stop_codon:yes gene_type:complete
VEKMKVVSDKNALFARTNTECHELKVSPNSDEVLKIWIKEPTWLQVEQAMTSIMKIDTNTQQIDIDMNTMYRFMCKEFIEKTEPELTTTEILRLSPYIGSQLKDVLPNPFTEFMGDDTGKET